MLKVLTEAPGIEESVLSSCTPSLKLHERIPIPFSQILCPQVMECEPETQNWHQKFSSS